MSTAIIEQAQGELATGKPKTLKALIQGDAFKKAVAAALPKHLTADRFCRVAATALLRVPKLAACDQTSFFNCLLTLSQYGLEPDGRNAHLIPFENRRAGIIECQLIIDYKGLVELAMRSGLIASIHADVICTEDDFEYNMGEIKVHRIDLKKDRGEAYGAYARVVFKDGSTKCEVMPTADIEAIRKRSRSGQNGPWVTDWREMAKKTCFRRLSKWISISAEFRDAVDSDDDVIETTLENRAKVRIADLVMDMDELPAPTDSGMNDDVREPEPEPGTTQLQATVSPPNAPTAPAKKAAAKKLIDPVEEMRATLAGIKDLNTLNKLRLEFDARTDLDADQAATISDLLSDKNESLIANQQQGG